ncbi:Intraflagellar transport protein 88-like protein [Hypsibius exemplaris]|uniref:Intraflagellar transport protein 88-like protein n=1 Tax=Hypsibius exemplaris TaxID=2072580 RepID=A0A1W0WSZ7_HYPEX|nr:Intraflagellar transport protein 88-like protein [Hypsibius exemplaris]
MASKSRVSLRDEFDDLYEGYEDSSVLGAQKDILEDPGLQRAIQSSHGERDRLGTARRNLLSSRLGIQTAKPVPRPIQTPKLTTGNKNSDAYRPASSIRGAGYTAKSGRSSASSGVGSPSGRLSSGTPVMVPTIEPGENDQPARAAINEFRRLEREVQTILDDAAVLVVQNQHAKAIEKMKQSEKMRRKLHEIPDWNPAERKSHLDPLLLKMSWYNAEVLVASHRLDDAMKVYVELRNTVGPDEQLSVLMRIALLHRRRKEYEQALKLLHKLLDDLPTDQSHDRLVVLREAAACHALTGRWDTAYKYCQMILQDTDGPEAAFNSLVCLVALKSDSKRIESAFVKLVSLKADFSATPGDRMDPGVSEEYKEMISHDSLFMWEKQRKQKLELYILNAAQLVANLDSDAISGYEWCIEQAKNAGRTDILSALEIAKANTYLKAENFAKTLEVLMSHDTDEEEPNLRAQSCGMLAFLNFHLGNFKLSKENADKAYEANKLSLQACLNKGCLEYKEDNFSAALQYFQEALILNSADFRASYYAGMTLKALGNYQDALTVFMKLNSVHLNRPTVLYQISQIYQLMEEPAEAFAQLEKIYTLHPREPFILRQLGELADKLGDKGAALWYYNESHRIFPLNVDVLNWLGRFFVASQFPEKAITYFEQASKIDDSVPKWPLLAAGAMRRAGHLTDAYNKYVDIHTAFPDDPDCLKVLVRICQETHAPAAEIAKYQQELDLLLRMRPREVPATAGGRSQLQPQSLGARPPTAAGKNAFGQQSGFSPVLSAARSGLSTANFNLDAEDLEEFNVTKQRPATVRKAGKLAVLEQTSLDDAAVDDILPGMVRK